MQQLLSISTEKDVKRHKTHSPFVKIQCFDLNCDKVDNFVLCDKILLAIFNLLEKGKNICYIIFD